MAKFTFKKNDRHSHWNGEYADVKLQGKICGWYQKREDTQLWEVWFSIERPKDECSWSNVRLKQRFSTEEELRVWLVQQSEEIQNALPLHFRIP